jgi:hypothetical protein
MTLSGSVSLPRSGPLPMSLVDAQPGELLAGCATTKRHTTVSNPLLSSSSVSIPRESLGGDDGGVLLVNF